LALSLEVAEHLPPESANSFVASLVQLAPAVLFSAAVPGQGGVQHINEQWQSFWARCFERQGYRTVDILRPRIWADSRVAFYYRQNALLYVAQDTAASLTSLPATPVNLDIVHPEMLRAALAAAAPSTLGFLGVTRLLPSLLHSAIRRWIRRPK
jgi:hypothetical protein